MSAGVIEGYSISPHAARHGAVAWSQKPSCPPCLALCRCVRKPKALIQVGRAGCSLSMSCLVAIRLWGALGESEGLGQLRLQLGVLFKTS